MYNIKITDQHTHTHTHIHIMCLKLLSELSDTSYITVTICTYTLHVFIINIRL